MDLPIPRRRTSISTGSVNSTRSCGGQRGEGLEVGVGVRLKVMVGMEPGVGVGVGAVSGWVKLEDMSGGGAMLCCDDCILPEACVGAA